LYIAKAAVFGLASRRALYRITHDGWTADQAYSEMKKYHFYSVEHDALKRHHALKYFVYRYYNSIHSSLRPKAES
jgi:hypothetical protein